MPLQVLVAAPANVWEWINFYGSGIGAVAGVGAAVIAILTLVSAALDNRARSQPMITAEFKAAPESDTSAELVITNLGQTPARDVMVRFIPELELPADTTRASARYIVQRYSKQIPVLNPGQVLSNTWWAGENRGGPQLVNAEPTPDDVTIVVTYRGRGRRRLKDSFPLSMDTVKLTTSSFSSTSQKGLMTSMNKHLKTLADKTAAIATAMNKSRT